MLYVLVMEKSEGQKDLLQVMGLQPRNYWKAFILFYLLVFFITNVIFVVFGKLIVGGWFFANNNIPMLVPAADPVRPVHRLGPQPDRPRAADQQLDG